MISRMKLPGLAGLIALAASTLTLPAANAAEMRAFRLSISVRASFSFSRAIGSSDRYWVLTQPSVPKDKRNIYLLYGGGLVFIGIIAGLILPNLRGRRSNSGWA